MPSFNIKGSVAFVTGTNKPNGLGCAFVDALVANGAAKVYATARDASQVNYLVAAHPGKVVAVALDVTDLDAIADLSELYPDVNLLINNAGYVGYVNTLEDLEKAVAEIKINYVAPLAIGQSFAPLFAELNSVDEHIKPSALINLASLSSFINFPIFGTYSATKAAVHSLTQAQRRDFGNSLVIGVYPGPIDTDAAKDMQTGTPKVPPGEVADAIVAALNEGTEDVFPDAASQQLYAAWHADAKAMEKNMAA
jgi:NAD(P)-dependent dehydrogenase (short-subunit alcohol dehydrogenase family)